MSLPSSGGQRPPSGYSPLSPLAPRPYSGPRRHHQSQANQKNRKNDRIRVAEVRVIGPDGKQLGVLPTREALEIAKRVGLDLVEVSPNAQPPVCRIVDFGKFMYDQSKKTKDNHKPTAQKVKEIKFRLNIDSHDYITKMRHAEEFLGDGNKLKMTLMFRGRELEHQARGITLVNQAIQDLSGVGTADNQPKLVGRSIVITVTPLPANRRKPKFTEAPEESSKHS